MKKLFVLSFISLNIATYASQSTLIWISNGAPSIQEQIQAWEYENQQRYARNELLPTTKDELFKLIADLNSEIEQCDTQIKQLKAKLSEIRTIWPLNEYYKEQNKTEKEYFNELDRKNQLLCEKDQAQRVLHYYSKNSE